MKTPDPDNHDEPLRKVLREWRSEAPLPPRFREQVWRRIARAETLASHSVWDLIAHWGGSVLSRPALAVSYVAVFLALGVTAGWAQARQETARAKDKLSQRYVSMLDPYQVARP